MFESWVVIATNRVREPYRRAQEVLKTDAKLAIAVDGNMTTYKNLQPLRNENPDRFMLKYGEYRQSAEATNDIYGDIRKPDPSKNHFIVAIPDDMALFDGWLDEFKGCFNYISKDGIGLLVGNDNQSGYQLAGFAGVTDKFLDLYQKGWLSCPVYLHWWIDHEIGAIAKRENKWFVCHNARAFHTMIDYRKNQASKDWGQDTRVFRSRRSRGFPYDEISEASWRYWK